MAVVLHKNADVTVADIAARNNIARKIDHMIVVVEDAIADPDAGSGIATYRWNATGADWILMSKSSYQSMSFATEELVISSGQVTPANIPADNQIWNIAIVDVDVVIAEPRIEDLTIGAGVISGLAPWEGKKIRFSYAYGSVAQQITSYVGERVESELTNPTTTFTFANPPLGSNFATLLQPGVLSVLTGTSKWFPPMDMSILRIQAFVDVDPTGADLILRINKNGAEIATVTIADGNSITTPIDLNVPMTLTDYLTVDVVQVGSTTAGENLTVRLTY